MRLRRIASVLAGLCELSIVVSLYSLISSIIIFLSWRSSRPVPNKYQDLVIYYKDYGESILKISLVVLNRMRTV